MYEDGTVYEGERQAGRCHGKGKLIFSGKKGSYEGEFKNGKRHGYGVHKSHNIVIGKPSIVIHNIIW